jgi:hypothetical protein
VAGEFILCRSAAPVRRQGAYGCRRDRTPTHGYEPTREAAMAAFAKCRRRE